MELTDDLCNNLNIYTSRRQRTAADGTKGDKQKDEDFGIIQTRKARALL